MLKILKIYASSISSKTHEAKYDGIIREKKKKNPSLLLDISISLSITDRSSQKISKDTGL